MTTTTLPLLRLIKDYKLLICILLLVAECVLFLSFHASSIRAKNAAVSKPSFDLVVSYYNENLNWTLPYHDSVSLYNKGPAPSSSFDSFHFKRVIRTPNVGREAYVYLHHIITHYDNLAGLTLFFQGDAYVSHRNSVLSTPQDYINAHKASPWFPVISRWSHTRSNHVWGRIRHLGDPLEELHADTEKQHTDAGKPRLAKGTLADFWYDIFNTRHPEFIKVSYSSNIGVTRDAIQRYPREWYELILSKYLSDHENPEEAMYMELLWHSIWF